MRSLWQTALLEAPTLCAWRELRAAPLGPCDAVGRGQMVLVAQALTACVTGRSCVCRGPSSGPRSLCCPCDKHSRHVPRRPPGVSPEVRWVRLRLGDLGDWDQDWWLSWGLLLFSVSCLYRAAVSVWEGCWSQRGPAPGGPAAAAPACFLSADAAADGPRSPARPEDKTNVRHVGLQ